MWPLILAQAVAPFRGMMARVPYVTSSFACSLWLSIALRGVASVPDLSDVHRICLFSMQSHYHLKQNLWLGNHILLLTIIHKVDVFQQ